mmetsp:Transcript_28490/g.67892  ORF Transcript_28490/g.67892 Transcript_28490/m.67892 type:complete len:341 (-) Transcript_28490:271-1293(-)
MPGSVQRARGHIVVNLQRRRVVVVQRGVPRRACAAAARGPPLHAAGRLPAIARHRPGGADVGARQDGDRRGGVRGARLGPRRRRGQRRRRHPQRGGGRGAGLRQPAAAARDAGEGREQPPRRPPPPGGHSRPQPAEQGVGRSRAGRKGSGAPGARAPRRRGRRQPGLGAGAGRRRRRRAGAPGAHDVGVAGGPAAVPAGGHLQGGRARGPRGDGIGARLRAIAAQPGEPGGAQVRRSDAAGAALRADVADGPAGPRGIQGRDRRHRRRRLCAPAHLGGRRSRFAPCEARLDCPGAGLYRCRKAAEEVPPGVRERREQRRLAVRSPCRGLQVCLRLWAGEA